MSVRISKSAFNIREKLSELEKPIGVKGNELMRAETAQEAGALLGVGRKNVIINGDMRVAQRGGADVTGVTGQTSFVTDRWKSLVNGLGTWTMGHSSDGPPGFSKSLKMSCTTANASPTTSQYAGLQYLIEGYDSARFEMGTSDAKYMTLSFWVKSTNTGTFLVEAQAGSPSIELAKPVTINSANTWEYKTITWQPNTVSATYQVTNSAGLVFYFFWDVGTDTNSPPTQWAEQTVGSGRWAGSTLNLGRTTGTDIYLTGVQLEVGKNATEFEHRSYGEELALCSRYFQQIGNLYLHTWSHDIADTSGMRLEAWSYPGGPMRTTPTFSFSDGSGNTDRWYVQDSDAAYGSTNVLYSLQNNEYGLLGSFKYPYAVSGFAKGQSGYAAAYNLTLSAEL